MGSRMFGPRVGRIAALVMATAPIVVVNSKLATTDARLALSVLRRRFCLWTLSRRPSTVAACLLACLALATLLKGPVGPAMILAAGIVSWAWGARPFAGAAFAGGGGCPLRRSSSPPGSW